MRIISDVAMMKHSGAKQTGDASQLISSRIADLGDWRGETLGRIRALIKETVPDVLEEWKWMGTPVWSHNGIICTGESYKSVVKTTFAKGAFLEDPSHLFNSSLDGNMRRAIDFREGEQIDTKALKALIREAVELNALGKKGAKPAAKGTPSKAAKAKPVSNAAKPAKAAPAARAAKTAKAAPPKRGKR
jgi:hypothetical protein